MTVVKQYGRVSETPCFQGKIHRRSPQIVNCYGDRELIPRSVFNSSSRGNSWQEKAHSWARNGSVRGPWFAALFGPMCCWRNFALPQMGV